MGTRAKTRPFFAQNWFRFRREWILATVAFLSVFIVIAPALWLVITSFKTNENIFVYPPQILPAPFTFQNYIDVLNDGRFPRYLLNSIMISFGATFICVVFSALAAYALTFFEFKGRNTALTVIVGTQFFPTAILLLPLFLMCAELGLFDTYFSLVATYTASNMSLCTWLLVGFFRAIPREVIDAARLDGSSRVRTLIFIVVPLSLPGLMAGGAFILIGIWQEFLLAVTLINDPDKLTAMVGLFKFIGENSIAWNLLIAASVIVSIPTIILFGLIQRYIVDGAMAGAVK